MLGNSIASQRKGVKPLFVGARKHQRHSSHPSFGVPGPPPPYGGDRSEAWLGGRTVCARLTLPAEGLLIRVDTYQRCGDWRRQMRSACLNPRSGGVA